MIKITNLTNSPYDLQGASGLVRVPAFGSVESEFLGEYLELLRLSGAVRVETVEPKLEHADSPAPAPAPAPAPEPEPEPEPDAAPVDLRAQYKALAGKDADGRWNDTRVAAEIEALQKA